MAHNTGNARGRADSLPTYTDKSVASEEENIKTTAMSDSVCQEVSEVHQDSLGYEVQSSTVQEVGDPPPAIDRPRNLYSASAHSARRMELSSGRHRFERAPLLEPPVTKATLSELDVNRIVHNPKLRHDVNFDPDLCFRPNTDGEKGQRKMHRARQFWDMMEHQLKAYLSNREKFEQEFRGVDWCLSVTLRAVRCILETVVPQEDRASVQETFNIDLLMQQFSKGAADLGRLSLWASALLKSHCAPMRDSWVDSVVELLTKGERDLDPNALTEGMKTLLEVLEAMRLDLANHQIRCLRPLMIENTIHFEQEFFMKKITQGKLDILAVHTWFRQATRSLTESTQPERTLWDFMRALVDLILPLKTDHLPCTFSFDEDRLVKLRSDLQDLINIQVCVVLHQGLDKQGRQHQAHLSAQDDLHKSTLTPSRDDWGRLSKVDLPVEQGFARPLSSSLSSDAGLLSTAGDGKVAPSCMSCSSSTSILTSSMPEGLRSTQLHYSSLQTDSTGPIRSSLRAIIASSSGSDRWVSLVPSMALQIVRSTPVPLTILPQFESKLPFHLSDRKSRVYLEAEKHVLSQLFPILRSLVDGYVPLTNYQIFEAATSPKVQFGSRGGSHTVACANVKEEITTLATRLAHVGVLHWRIWSPLAYLADPQAVDHEGI